MIRRLLTIRNIHGVGLAIYFKPHKVVITTLFGLIMPPLGYLLYRRAENYARKHGSLSTY